MSIVVVQRSGPAEYRLAISLFGLSLPYIAMINCFPLLLGTFIDDAGMSSIEAGSLFTLELFAGAAVSLLLSRILMRFDLRCLALAGSLAVASGDLLSALVPVDMMWLVRIFAGLGAGLCINAAGRVVASSRIPSRLAGAVAIASAFAGAVMAFGAGIVIERYDYPGGYFYLATIGAVATLCAVVTPRSRKQSVEAREQGYRQISGRASALVGATFLVFTGSGAIWNASERIGVSIGLSTTIVANIIAGTALAGIAGSIAALATASLHRDFLAAAIGIGVLSVSSAAFAVSGGLCSYAATMSVLSFAYFFVTPFLLSTSVKIDRSGELAGFVQGAQLLAGATAPLIGGVLIAGHTFFPITIFAAGTGGMAVLAVAFAAYGASSLSENQSIT